MEPDQEIVRAFVFDHLKDKSSGQVDEVLDAVILRGSSRGIPGFPSRDRLPYFNRKPLRALVEEILSVLQGQGVLVWGLGDSSNNGPPFFRLTEDGKKAVAEGRPTPYDAEGFLKEFDRQVPAADKVVREYLEESVRVFNVNCFRAAAVLIGGASEKAVLLLYEQFGKQISDPAKRAKFEKDSGPSIHKKFSVLKNRLDLMVQAKKLSYELTEHLPAIFDLIRRCRNEAGHPQLGGVVDRNTILLNLRVFPEYARRVFALITFFQTSPADW